MTHDTCPTLGLEPAEASAGGPVAKILIIEGEQHIARVVQACLGPAGYQVIIAGDGQMALHEFRHEQPDLIVPDLTLPGIDGLDVCRTIRKESDTRCYARRPDRCHLV